MPDENLQLDLSSESWPYQLLAIMAADAATGRGPLTNVKREIRLMLDEATALPIMESDRCAVRLLREAIDNVIFRELLDAADEVFPDLPPTEN